MWSTGKMVKRKPQDNLHRFLGITPLLMKFGVTANQVTVGRGILVLPVVILASFGLYLPAFFIHLLSWWGDSIDGSIARERLLRGYKDNKNLGEFLDPMIDKITWISEILLIPWGGNFASVPNKLFFIGIGAMSILVIIETWLGIIRVQDYMMNRENKKHHIKLAADQSGKIKMVFEVVGLSALILAMRQKEGQYWIYWIWCLSLIIAIPFAVKSLINKYHRR